MKKVTLPSGNTVNLKDPKTLKVGDRKKILKAVGEQDTAIAQGLTMIDGLIAMLIDEWSFDLMIPSVKLDSLDQLDIADYDALSQEAESARAVLFPQFNDNTEVDSPKGN